MVRERRLCRPWHSHHETTDTTVLTVPFDLARADTASAADR
jgi:hypothetical protein